MSKAVDSLLKFLSTASQKELDENFKNLEKYCDVGPLAKDFVERELSREK